MAKIHDNVKQNILDTMKRLGEDDYDKFVNMMVQYGIMAVITGDFIKYDYMLEQKEGDDGFKEAFQRAVNSENLN